MTIRNNGVIYTAIATFVNTILIMMLMMMVTITIMVTMTTTTVMISMMIMIIFLLTKRIMIKQLFDNNNGIHYY